MKIIKILWLVVIQVLLLTSGYCQVPNTALFTLQNVQANLPGNPNNLSGCFSSANSHYFDPSYNADNYVPPGSLLRFRNYHSRHYIGESYQGGVIFYIYPDGLSGLICGTLNLGSTEYPFCRWFNGFNRSSISTSTALGTGKQNTTNILSTIGASGWAAKACVDYRGGGYADWYLPSLEETWYIYYNLFYAYGNLNGFFSTDVLWSSSQADAVYAWQMTMTGAERFEDDYNYERVRPIRKFVDNVPVYYSAARQVTATKNSCGAGYTGSTETYYMAYAAVISEISQADADNQAIFYAASHAQAYANEVGTCTPLPVYYSAATSTSVQRNDCPEGYISGTVNFTTSYGQFSSTISQEDADAQAQIYIYANKQTFANSNGTCTPTGSTFYNVYMSQQFQKQGCESSGRIGEWVDSYVGAGWFSSTISQYDADTQAWNWLAAVGQAKANSEGRCFEIGYLSLNNLADYDGASPDGSITIIVQGCNGTTWLDAVYGYQDNYFAMAATSGDQYLEIHANDNFIGTRMVWYNGEVIGIISAGQSLYVYGIPYYQQVMDVAIGDLTW